jgi:hypothetical protein
LVGILIIRIVLLSTFSVGAASEIADPATPEPVETADQVDLTLGLMNLRIPG